MYIGIELQIAISAIKTCFTDCKMKNNNEMLFNIHTKQHNSLGMSEEINNCE